MPEPIAIQLSAFLLFFLGGIVLGFLFDLLRASRWILRPRGVGSFLLDLLFWAAVLAGVFALLFFGTWGDPRLFVWLAMACGLAYYLCFPASIGRPLARGLVKSIVRGWPAGKRFIQAPPAARRRRRAEKPEQSAQDQHRPRSSKNDAQNPESF